MKKHLLHCDLLIVATNSPLAAQKAVQTIDSIPVIASANTSIVPSLTILSCRQFTAIVSRLNVTFDSLIYLSPLQTNGPIGSNGCSESKIIESGVSFGIGLAFDAMFLVVIFSQLLLAQCHEGGITPVIRTLAF